MSISSRFTSNSEANASELLVNLEEMFPRYLYYLMCNEQMSQQLPISKQLSSKRETV